VHDRPTAGKSALILGGALVSMLLGAGTALADITYIVDQTIGNGGVTGTITTDGTIGTLDISQFVAWDLTVTGTGNSGLESYNLTNANSVVLNYGANGYYGAYSDDVTATAQHIYFNFSGSDAGYLGFQSGGAYTGDHYWCSATGNQGFDCLAGGQTATPVDYSDSSTQFQSFSGNQIIATTAVPESATWALMLAGFAGLGLAGYRATRKAALATA
jgi:hypothetical protein